MNELQVRTLSSLGYFGKFQKANFLKFLIFVISSLHITLIRVKRCLNKVVSLTLLLFSNINYEVHK